MDFNSTQPSAGVNMPALIGSVVGVSSLLLCIVGAALWLNLRAVSRGRRQRQQQKQQSEPQPELQPELQRGPPLELADLSIQPQVEPTPFPKRGLPKIPQRHPPIAFLFPSLPSSPRSSPASPRATLTPSPVPSLAPFAPKPYYVEVGDPGDTLRYSGCDALPVSPAYAGYAIGNTSQAYSDAGGASGPRRQPNLREPERSFLPVGHFWHRADSYAPPNPFGSAPGSAAPSMSSGAGGARCNLSRVVTPWRSSSRPVTDIEAGDSLAPSQQPPSLTLSDRWNRAFELLNGIHRNSQADEEERERRKEQGRKRNAI